MIYPGRCRLILRIGVVVLLQAQVRGQVADEYQVKAAYLYNFAKFVQWPSQVFKSATDPIAICVLGTDLFGESLVQAVNGKSLAGRPLTVRRLSDSQQAGACQILFVSLSERKRLAAIFSEIAAHAVLTVGETDNFTSEGGVVNLRLEGGRVRIQINLTAAEKNKLSISAKLLSLAQIERK